MLVRVQLLPQIVLHHIGVCCFPVTEEIAGSNPVSTAKDEITVFKYVDYTSLIWESASIWR